MKQSGLLLVISAAAVAPHASADNAAALTVLRQTAHSARRRQRAFQCRRNLPWRRRRSLRARIADVSRSMSDDPNFNPNAQLPGSWNELQAVHASP